MFFLSISPNIEFIIGVICKYIAHYANYKDDSVYPTCHYSTKLSIFRHVQIHIVKIGGAVINEEKDLGTFLVKFAAMPGSKILVHGGGRAATELSKSLGIETKIVDGRRITDQETLGVAVMVYAGLVNKSIVARLQALGVNALGVCGADLDVLRSIKRPVTDIDYGFVGDIAAINGPVLNELLEHERIPVVSPITHDGAGQLLNTNADTIASRIAQTMCEDHEVHLHLCFEKAGVLQYADDDASKLDMLSQEDFVEMLKDKKIHSGMIPKLQNAFEAKVAGVSSVQICSFRTLGKAQSGTSIIL